MACLIAIATGDVPVKGTRPVSIWRERCRVNTRLYVHLVGCLYPALARDIQAFQ